MYRGSYIGGLRMPELGRLDRMIYALAISACLLVTCLLVPSFLFLENKIPFLDQRVVAYSNRAGILGLLLAVLMLGLVTGSLISGRSRKYPIFGAPGETYGGPEWTAVYPLLMPTRDAPEEVRRAVREGRQLVCVLLAAAILGGLIFGVSLFSGNRIFEDGSIRWLWGFGTEAAHFDPEDVEQVTLHNRLTGSNRGSSSMRYEITLEFRMLDGRSCSFFLRDFRQDGKDTQVGILKELLAQYSGAELVCLNGGRLQELFQDQHFSPKDQTILRELFGE